MRRKLSQPAGSVGMPMAKLPTPETIASELAVPERILLFCLASDTDWAKAGVTHSDIQHMLVRNLVEREQAANRFVFTAQRRAVLAALLEDSTGEPFA
jgi:hypothetical protein